MTTNSKNVRSDCFLPVSTFHNSNFTKFMYHLELSHSTCCFIKLIFLHHLYHLWFSISVSTQFLLVLLPFQFLRHILDFRWPLRDFAKRLGTKKTWTNGVCSELETVLKAGSHFKCGNMAALSVVVFFFFGRRPSFVMCFYMLYLCICFPTAFPPLKSQGPTALGPQTR